jgi:hypothetical protein
LDAGTARLKPCPYETHLKAVFIISMTDPTPALVEGEDFYFEDELMVFTAAYLLRRGYCCGSGCRHCPYTEKSAETE